METLIVHPNNKEQLTAIKAFMKALKISFEETKESPYDPEFVAMVKRGEEQIKKGEARIVNIDDL